MAKPLPCPTLLDFVQVMQILGSDQRHFEGGPYPGIVACLDQDHIPFAQVSTRHFPKMCYNILRVNSL
jgi:hypothetical protein